jgi:crotonobetainyl-CoA:carnitine CoA-transferase CaiB-like acyl-CoA transferase
VCLVVRTEAEFEARVGTLGLPELAADERFDCAQARADNDDALIAALGAHFAEKPAHEWESSLHATGVGCVAVNMQGQPAFTSFDPVLRETGLTVAFDHPLFGEMVRSAPPVAFSETPGRVCAPCFRGQNNRVVLAELGYGDDEIAELEARGVVIPPD